MGLKLICDGLTQIAESGEVASAWPAMTTSEGWELRSHVENLSDRTQLAF